MAPALASVAREAVLGQSLSDHPGRLASFGCEPNVRSEYKGRHARFRTSSIRSPSEWHKSLLCPRMTLWIFLFFWHQDPASACHLVSRSQIGDVLISRSAIRRVRVGSERVD